MFYTPVCRRQFVVILAVAVLLAGVPWHSRLHADEPVRADEPASPLKLVQAFDKGIDVEKTAVYGVAVSADGKHVLIGGDSASAMMTLWNVETGETESYFDIFTMAIDGSPYSPALSPDGKLAAVATTLGKAYFFDLATNDVLKKMETSVFAPSIRFSPDSRLVAMINMEGKVFIVECRKDAEPFPVKTEFLAHAGLGITLSWNGDGTRLATSSGDKTVKIWDVATQKEVLKLPHDECVWSVAYSSDSKLIATGTGGGLKGHPFNQNYLPSDDNTVRLWDAAEGKMIREFKGHTERIRCLAITPDGKQIVSGSFDKTIRAWDAATGKELAKVEGKSWIWSLDMAANTKTIAVGAGSLFSRQRGYDVFPEERVRVFRLEE